MTLSKKACVVIENLSCGDFIVTDKLISDIYKAAHVGAGHCENPHEDWKSWVEECYNEFTEKEAVR